MNSETKVDALDYCPKCNKTILRPNVAYGINPDAICICPQIPAGDASGALQPDAPSVRAAQAAAYEQAAQHEPMANVYEGKRSVEVWMTCTCGWSGKKHPAEKFSAHIRTLGSAQPWSWRWRKRGETKRNGGQMSKSRKTAYCLLPEHCAWQI